jgi:hypothetical protein
MHSACRSDRAKGLSFTQLRAMALSGSKSIAAALAVPEKIASNSEAAVPVSDGAGAVPATARKGECSSGSGLGKDYA